MKERKYTLSEKDALKAVTDAVHEVYAHKPVKLAITLMGAVDEIPMIHIESDSYVYSWIFGEGAEDGADMQ